MQKNLYSYSYLYRHDFWSMRFYLHGKPPGWDFANLYGAMYTLLDDNNNNNDDESFHLTPHPNQNSTVPLKPIPSIIIITTPTWICSKLVSNSNHSSIRIYLGILWRLPWRHRSLIWKQDRMMRVGVAGGELCRWRQEWGEGFIEEEAGAEGADG